MRDAIQRTHQLIQVTAFLYREMAASALRLIPGSR